MGSNNEIRADRRLTLVKCGRDSAGLNPLDGQPLPSAHTSGEQPDFSVDSWLYSRIFFALPEPTLLVDVASGCVLDVNDAVLKWLSIGCSEVVGKHFREVLSNFRGWDGGADFLNSLDMEELLSDNSSSIIDMDTAKSTSSGFSYIKIKGRAADYALVRIFPQSTASTHDEQVTLANPENQFMAGVGVKKDYCLALLDSLCERSAVDGKYFAVFCVGLDSFSEYRRNFGSAFPQRLVECVEDLLSKITPVGSGVFQLDESSIVVVVPAPTAVESFGDHIRCCLSKPIIIDNFKFKVSVSVGCYFSSFGDHLNSATCIDRVTSARKRAVLEGGDRVVLYDGSGYTAFLELLSSIYSVREVLSREELVYSFIPYISRNTYRRTFRLSFDFESAFHSPNQSQSDSDSLILLAADKDISEFKISKALAILSDWVSSNIDLGLTVVLESGNFLDADFVSRLEIILGRFEYNVRSRLQVEMSCDGCSDGKYRQVFELLSDYGVVCSLKFSNLESIFESSFDGSIVKSVVVPGVNLDVGDNYLGALYIIEALSDFSCKESIDIFVEHPYLLPDVEIYNLFGIGVVGDASSSLPLAEINKWYEKSLLIEGDGYFGCRCLSCFKLKLKSILADKCLALSEFSEDSDTVLHMLKVGLASIFRQLSSEAVRSPKLEVLLSNVVARIRSISRAYLGNRGQHDIFLRLAENTLELFDDIDRFLLSGKERSR